MLVAMRKEKIRDVCIRFAKVAQKEVIQPESRIALELASVRREFSECLSPQHAGVMAEAISLLDMGYDLPPGCVVSNGLRGLIPKERPMRYSPDPFMEFGQMPFERQDEIIKEIAREPALVYLVDEFLTYQELRDEVFYREATGKGTARARKELREANLPLLEGLKFPVQPPAEVAVKEWLGPLKKLSEIDLDWPQSLAAKEKGKMRLEVAEVLRREPGGELSFGIRERGMAAVLEHYRIFDDHDLER